MELNEHFNAGYGSYLTSDGKLEMMASVIDGTTMEMGSVFGLNCVRHPISVASKLLKEETNILAGDSTMDFVEDHNFEIIPTEHMMSEKSLTSFLKWRKSQKEV